ncbi:tyrosine-type recombinase/integrase [Aquabacterium sp.]|uniref:tyrosine-type recombinase/integrase n=1 Tax=Aquabacterium sp. TaxID=1872578 RepID=UPI00351D0046
MTLHVMRHSHASRLLDGGMSVLEVQQQLGHRHLQSTTVYLHADNKASSRKAAGILNG